LGGRPLIFAWNIHIIIVCHCSSGEAVVLFVLLPLHSPILSWEHWTLLALSCVMQKDLTSWERERLWITRSLAGGTSLLFRSLVIFSDGSSEFDETHRYF
jgi:hypothetical protein